MESGVDFVAVLLTLQFAQLVAGVGELAAHTEQEMTEAARIDDDGVVFVERKRRPVLRDSGLTKAEIVDLHSRDGFACIGQADRQNALRHRLSLPISAARTPVRFARAAK
jgi:hypothetical protein